jgi:hypothetical protein
MSPLEKNGRQLRPLYLRAGTGTRRLSAGSRFVRRQRWEAPGKIGDAGFIFGKPSRRNTVSG